MVPRWTRDEIAMEILSLYAEGAPLHYGSMAREHPVLLRAAHRHFGSWRSAVEFAGLSYDEVKRYRTWTRARILARIQELHRQGVDLSWRNVSTRVDPRLAAAATKPNRFGSWRRAIEEAGLDYDQVRRYREWTPERIVAEVRRLVAEGWLLNSKEAQTHQIDLFAAALRQFGTWDDALRAAGLDASQIRLRSPYRVSRRRRPRQSISLEPLAQPDLMGRPVGALANR